MLSLFLSSLPAWAGWLLVVLAPTALAMCGPVAVRRRYALERLTTNNEIAGFKFATVGVIYAVLLAFAVIIVWERFSDAENAVADEAGAAATIYRLAAGDAAENREVKRALTRYLQAAIEKDWPQMAHEQESPDATHALDALYAATVRLAERGATRDPVMYEVFHQLDSITQARRHRLHLAHGIVPTMLWTVLVCGGVLTVAFTLFFGTRNLRAQVLMTGILALIVFMGLFVIVSINYPFAGPVHITEHPIQMVLDDFAGGS